MRRVAIILTAILSLQPIPASAWSPQDSTEPGFHQVIVEDTVSFFRQFSFLNSWKNDNWFVCPGYGTGVCKDLKSGMFNVILPACEFEDQVDCIETLAVQTASKSQVAIFERYTMPSHPSKFVGDGKNLPRNPESPSIWELSDFPHEGGTKYAVHVGYDGGISNGRVTSRNFYAQIYAVTEVPGRGEAFDQNNYSNFAWCDFDKTTRKQNGCGAGGNVEGFVCVVQFQVGGSCGARQPLPQGVSFTLTVRLSKESNGWYHGRLKSPAISLDKMQDGVKVTISGDPVDVPIVYHAGNYRDFSDSLKKYWDDCAGSSDCPKFTREFGANLARQPGGIRNITSEQKPWTPKSLSTVKFFTKISQGRSPKADRVWAVRSLENVKSSLGKCYSGLGLKGLITTNATSYTDGPPSLSRGVLRYSLAAPSILESTGEEIFGNYDLVMRSSFAKCIYGSSNISPRAEVTVSGFSENVKVATSVTSRTRDWIRLSANNFNY